MNPQRNLRCEPRGLHRGQLNQFRRIRQEPAVKPWWNRGETARAAEPQGGGWLPRGVATFWKWTRINPAEPSQVAMWLNLKQYPSFDNSSIDLYIATWWNIHGWFISICKWFLCIVPTRITSITFDWNCISLKTAVPSFECEITARNQWHFPSFFEQFQITTKNDYYLTANGLRFA